MSLRKGLKAEDLRRCSRTLMLMRHAKTGRQGSQGDRSRQLTDRGQRQARIMGRGLTALGLVPDRIICSGAPRARQTLDGMLKPLGDGPRVDYRESLYESGMQAVFDELAQTEDRDRRVLILGHEPTMSICSQWLAEDNSDPDLLDLLNLGLPPATMVVLGSERPLTDWGTHQARLLGILGPQDLED